MTDQRPRAPAGDESTTATIISPAETRPEPSFGTAIASAAPGVRPSVAGATERGAVLDIVEHYGLLVLLVAVGAFFCVYPATHASFFSGANFVTLAGNQTVVAIVALAALLPMSAGYIDLSSGAITGVASCTFATCLTRFHQDILISLVAAIVVALACGTVNGILVARWGLSAIIATLGSQLALLGLIEWYTNDQTIGGGMSQNLIAFGSDNFLGIPEITWIFIPVLLAAWFLLEHTPFGRYLQAISSNRRSARLVGINVKRSVL
ncbi:MAG TPA: ABC transporter permease, partial [Acidimicrobiales bacterium]|nr:ABC transporter permease [Acidimicrobiales bacterium]